MSEKVKKIMVQGGFSVIIAVVAMALYLIVMYYSNEYFKEQTKPAEIKVSENGVVYIDGFEKEEDENIYILWETDAGNIKPEKDNSKFEHQYNDNNKWYYVNTDISEGVIWDGSDADGNEYITANIRAVIYSYDEKEKKSQYNMENYVNQMDITVTFKEGKVVEAKESRYFSNPVRKNDDGEWTQIYVINEDDNGNKTYRYRTGKKIEDEILVMCWESKDGILAETDYKEGLYPMCLVNKDNADKNLLVTTSTITVNSKENNGKEIKAYLIDEETYDEYEEGIDENNKKFTATTIIE